MYKLIIVFVGVVALLFGMSGVYAQGSNSTLNVRIEASGDVDSIDDDSDDNRIRDEDDSDDEDDEDDDSDDDRTIYDDDSDDDRTRYDDDFDDDRMRVDEGPEVIIDDVSGDVRVRGVVQNGTGVDDEIGEVRVNARATRAWSNDTKEIVRTRLEANDEKNTANDFGLMVALKASVYERVDDVFIAERVSADVAPVVTITYKAEKRLFGLFKKDIDTTVVVDAQGEVKVTSAASLLYRLFGFGNDKDTYIELAKEIQADAQISADVEVNENNTI